MVIDKLISLSFLLQRPKTINYKGKDVSNVFHLRSPEDANSIASLASSKNAVIVGTSFIGEISRIGSFWSLRSHQSCDILRSAKVCHYIYGSGTRV